MRYASIQAARAHEVARVRARDQRVVLGDTALDERQHVARGGRMAARRRFPPEAREPRRERRQRRAMPIELGRAVQRVAQQRERAARKRIRRDRRALDEPGVAEARAVAGRAAIDERNLAAAILQVQRGRYADDACAENDDVEIHEASVSDVQREWRTDSRQMNVARTSHDERSARPAGTERPKTASRFDRRSKETAGRPRDRIISSKYQNACYGPNEDAAICVFVGDHCVDVIPVRTAVRLHLDPNGGPHAVAATVSDFARRTRRCSAASG